MVAWPRYYPYLFIRSYVVSSMIAKGWDVVDAEYIADKTVWIEYRLRSNAISPEIATNLVKNLERKIEKNMGEKHQNAKRLCMELSEVPDHTNPLQILNRSLGAER
ncbi:MAG: hypothetical protein GXN93_01760 [Candidatus Diapherotrites archaeon]|nr:hypothetical protein [Candidatus Diapherotrites archaeon]